MISQKTILLLHSLFASSSRLLGDLLDRCSSLNQLQELLLMAHLQNSKQILQEFPSVYFLNKESICIEKGVQILPGALVEGPCYLGENVSIGHCAMIRKGTFLAKNVHIGHCSEISRSIFFEGAKAPHFNYVGDSMVGENVNLGAHVTAANLRLDKQEIILHFEGEKIATGGNKFGSLIGDNSSIGCAVTLNPGTIIEKNTQIPPLSTQIGKKTWVENS